jgi:hypothetical protein
MILKQRKCQMIILPYIYREKDLNYVEYFGAFVFFFRERSFFNLIDAIHMV